MQTNLLKVSFRQGAIYIPTDLLVEASRKASPYTLILVGQLAKLGYTLSEELLHAINTLSATDVETIIRTYKEILGVNLNWNPLVKGWDRPTGESELDHLVTSLCNKIGGVKGASRLACGHYIPKGTFPLERYNGCPFCGTPFEVERLQNYNAQASILRTLVLWKDADLQQYYRDLLTSKTALDATQVDSLKILLEVFPVPEVEVTMKETQILVADAWVLAGAYAKAGQYFTTPTDILRYLWYKQTGFLQLITPKTIVDKAGRNHTHISAALAQTADAKAKAKEALKLKYTRKECRMVATWLNELDMSAEQMCEIIHPKRGMWVRFIRALRLAEYARKRGFEHLNAWMDVFYNQRYTVYQGEVDAARLKLDADSTFALLKQRPGLFARSLFANMLWFGADVTLSHFKEVMHLIPMRLIFTLNMYAENYFDAANSRTVKPLGGNSKRVPANKLLANFTEEQLQSMVTQVEDMTIGAVMQRFQQIPTDSKRMYIDPCLYKIPLSIGDRSDSVQDLSSALMGTRFAVEGNSVRLFMQWGKDLPAQHLDMDLSAYISKENDVEICYYANLVASGAKHSGDIRTIPDNVGTAEYIELDIDELNRAGAKYVSFTCNAYSVGSITPNLVVGWMNSAYPMEISEATGIAYDPSCVQHQVRVTSPLAKGLLFGVLDVVAREIVWLEMPFFGQVAASMDVKAVERLLAKLDAKTTVGNLLATKAKAQQIELVDTPDGADEVYTLEWARNAAAVTKLLVD